MQHRYNTIKHYLVPFTYYNNCINLSFVYGKFKLKKNWYVKLKTFLKCAGSSLHLRIFNYFRSRSLNFSPQECSLLLQCVRQEKKDVFSKDTSGKANNLKNSAWTRVS